MTAAVLAQPVASPENSPCFQFLISQGNWGGGTTCPLEAQTDSVREPGVSSAVPGCGGRLRSAAAGYGRQEILLGSKLIGDCGVRVYPELQDSQEQIGTHPRASSWGGVWSCHQILRGARDLTQLKTTSSERGERGPPLSHRRLTAQVESGAFRAPTVCCAQPGHRELARRAGGSE